MYTSILEKNECKNVVYKSIESNWCLLRSRFLIRFCLFLVLLLNFFASASFETKFHFKSQVRLSQTNVIVPIRLKFKL